MKSIKPRVIVVAGPTAAGKSDLAIALARTFDGEVVSADSRQIYRGLDIGTGKVTEHERKSVPHWMLDIADPKRQYTAAQYKARATKAIAGIIRRGKTPVVAGGSGFWLDTLVYGTCLPNVRPDGAFRKTVSNQTTGELYARLADRDPARARTIDRHNRRRLVRALEIIHALGKPVPPVTAEKPYHLLYLAVVPEEMLSERIARRLDARLRHGMITEARRLHRQGVSWRRMESLGLEYRWLARHLQSKVTRSEMRDGLLHDILRYAKRQFTWWRRNPDVRWITSPTQAKRLARQFLT